MTVSTYTEFHLTSRADDLTVPGMTPKKKTPKKTVRFHRANLRCTRCDTWKSSEAFYIRRTKAGALTRDSWCMECRKAVTRARYVPAPAEPKPPAVCQNPSCGTKSQREYKVAFDDGVTMGLCRWCQTRSYDGREALYDVWTTLHRCLTTNARAHPKVKIDLLPLRGHERCESDALRIGWLIAMLARHGHPVERPAPTPAPLQPKREVTVETESGIGYTSRLDTILDGLTGHDPRIFETIQPDEADTRTAAERLDDILARTPMYGPGTGPGDAAT